MPLGAILSSVLFHYQDIPINGRQGIPRKHYQSGYHTNINTHLVDKLSFGWRVPCYVAPTYSVSALLLVILHLLLESLERFLEFFLHLCFIQIYFNLFVHYINYISFKKNTLQYRYTSGPSPVSSTRTAAVNAAPPVIHNHALSSFSPRSLISQFSFVFSFLITDFIVSQFW